MKPKNWLLVVAALALPVLVALVAQRLDHSEYRHAPAYKSAIPWAVFGALAVAVVGPAVVIARSSWRLRWRVAATLGVWSLLAVELYALFVSVMATR